MASFNPALLAGIVDTYSRSVLHGQTRVKHALLDEKVIGKHKGTEEGEVVLVSGWTNALSIKRDYDNLGDGSARDRTKLKYMPVAFEEFIAMGRIARLIGGNTKKAANHVVDELFRAGRSLNSALSRSMLSNDFGSPAQAQVSGDSTFHLADWRYVKPDMKLEVFDNANASKGTVTVVSVAQSDAVITGGGLITISGTIGFALATTDKVALVGAIHATEENFIGAYDAADDTATVYGSPAAKFEWAGRKTTTAINITAPNVKNECDEIGMHSGEDVDLIIGNRQQETKLYESQNDLVRFVDGPVDEYRYKMMVGGVPFLRDDNARRKTLLFCRREFWELHCYKDFSADSEPGAPEKGKNSFRRGRSKFQDELELTGVFQNRFHRRNTMGIWNNAEV